MHKRPLHRLIRTPLSDCPLAFSVESNDRMLMTAVCSMGGGVGLKEQCRAVEMCHKTIIIDCNVLTMGFKSACEKEC